MCLYPGPAAFASSGRGARLVTNVRVSRTSFTSTRTSSITGFGCHWLAWPQFRLATGLIGTVPMPKREQSISGIAATLIWQVARLVRAAHSRGDAC